MNAEEIEQRARKWNHTVPRIRTKLPPAFKKKWVKALRSGRYNQGKCWLYTKEYDVPQYCCLGVACRVAKVPIELIRDKDTIPNRADFKVVPSPIRGYTNHKQVVKFLTILNDDLKFSFKDIANWIEARL